MQPTPRASDVDQVRAALRALLAEPHPANFDRACRLIERLPPRQRTPGEPVREAPAGWVPALPDARRLPRGPREPGLN